MRSRRRGYIAAPAACKHATRVKVRWIRRCYSLSRAAARALTHGAAATYPRRVQRAAIVVILLVAACGGGSSPGDPDGGGDDASGDDAGGDPDAPAATGPLEIDFLGVQGWLIRHGDDVVLSAPLYTRASLIDVTLGNPVAVDTATIDERLGPLGASDIDAIISGHAHYDHLMDVPHVMTAHAPASRLYANMSAKHLFAALAPDRPPSCTSPPPAQPIARDRVIALDEPLASMVDYRGCPSQRPPGAPLEGTWMYVPGTRVRVMAFCSVHPDQFLFIHFGEGSIDEDQCELPAGANAWLEGATLAFLVDFLDEQDRPVHRVYYQDAPTELPIGEPPADILAERPVDVALLCVGSTANVENHPTAILGSLAPRFALSGHWEDFFQDITEPAQPLPFLDLDAYVTSAETAMTGTATPPLEVDGEPVTARHVLPMPGTRFRVPPI